jgi:hypothetical protein
MKNKINEIIENANLKTRQITVTETHGSNKNETSVIIQYWDPLHLRWTTYPEAISGHIYNILEPIISEAIKIYY